MSGSTRGEHAAGGGHVAEFFDAGHEQFQALSSALWDPIGRASVAVARPAVGQRVLDACCGAGASAVPTAEAVGHAGAVDAVDLADRLLEQGRAAATEAGPGWIRFVRDDVTRFGERRPTTSSSACSGCSCCRTWTPAPRTSSAWLVPEGGSW